MKAAPVQCIDCVHFDLHQFATMAREGYGLCGLDHRTGRFQSAVFERHCDGFAPAPAETVAKRRQWLAEQQERLHRAITGSNT